MNDLEATLGIADMTKLQMPRMTEELDEIVADFKHRPLDPRQLPTPVMRRALDQSARSRSRGQILGPTCR